MTNLKSKETFHLEHHDVIFVSWFVDFESIIGTNVLIDDKLYFIKDIERNRCTGFGQYKTDKEWDERELGLKAIPIQKGV